MRLVQEVHELRKYHGHTTKTVNSSQLTAWSLSRFGDRQWILPNNTLKTTLGGDAGATI